MYSGDLKSDLVWTLNGPKEVGLQMVWISNGIWNPEAWPFENQINGRHFVKNHLKSGQEHPDFEWSSFQTVGIKAIAKAWPFENQTIFNLTFNILNGRILDPHCIDLFWTYYVTWPTVLTKLFEQS